MSSSSFNPRRALSAAATAVAISLAGYAPAASAESRSPVLPVGYMNPQALELYCTLQGGTMDGDRYANNYYCVLPSGDVIFCDYQKESCVVFHKPPTPTTTTTKFTSVMRPSVMSAAASR